MDSVDVTGPIGGTSYQASGIAPAGAVIITRPDGINVWAVTPQLIDKIPRITTFVGVDDFMIPRI